MHKWNMDATKRSNRKATWKRNCKTTDMVPFPIKTIGCQHKQETNQMVGYTLLHDDTNKIETFAWIQWLKNRTALKQITHFSLGP